MSLGVPRCPRELCPLPRVPPGAWVEFALISGSFSAAEQGWLFVPGSKVLFGLEQAKESEPGVDGV